MTFLQVRFSVTTTTSKILCYKYDYEILVTSMFSSHIGMTSSTSSWSLCLWDQFLGLDPFPILVLTDRNRDIGWVDIPVGVSTSTHIDNRQLILLLQQTSTSTSITHHPPIVGGNPDSHIIQCRIIGISSLEFWILILCLMVVGTHGSRRHRHRCHWIWILILVVVVVVVVVGDGCWNLVVIILGSCSCRNHPRRIVATKTSSSLSSSSSDWDPIVDSGVGVEIVCL